MSAEPAFDARALPPDALFRHHPQPMWLVDVASLRLLDVNVAALERYRIERAAFLTRTLPELWIGPPPRLTAATSDPHVLASALAGPALHRRGDGGALRVEVSARPVQAAGRTVLLVGAREAPRPEPRPGADGELVTALLENGTDAVLVLDGDHRVEQANRGARVLLGARDDVLVGLELAQLLPQGDPLVPSLRGLVGTDALRAEVELVRLDGGRVPCELTFQPLPHGRTVALLRDVTMKRTAERALARSERRFRALIQNSSDIIVVMGIDGRAGYVSPSAARLGFSDPGARTDLRRAVHPRDRAEVLVAFERLVQEGGTRTATFRYRARGEWRWLEVAGTNLMGDVDVEGLVLNARDVTGRRSAESRLRESEAYYRALFEKSMEGAVLFDRNQRVRSVSGGALKLLGYLPDDLIGRPADELIHEDDRDAFVDALDLVEALAGSSEHVRYRLRDASGGWHWLEGTVTNLLTDPDVRAVMLNFREISDRVRAMEKIHALNGELRRRLAHVQSLRRIDMAITNSVDVRLVLDIFMDQVIADLEVDAVAVLLFEPGAARLTPFLGRGFAAELAAGRGVPVGEGPAGRAAREQRTVYIPDLRSEGERGSAVAGDAQARYASYLAVPMLAKGQLQGVIELYARRRLEPTDEWLEFLETYADQGAIAIENSQLLTSLERSNSELQLAYDRTIEGWAYALDLKDEETAGHSKRVTEMTVRLARRLGVPEEQMVHVQRGALLHDIGKMGIPDQILLKHEELTEDEYELMKRHTIYAYELLSPIEFLRPALDIPYCHHEKWAGGGYPRGLAGEQIPLSARIFAVVDVYDALTSDRPYRPAWPVERALAYIRAESGRHFDPRVVDAFFSLVDEGLVNDALTERALAAARSAAERRGRRSGLPDAAAQRPGTGLPEA